MEAKEARLINEYRSKRELHNKQEHRKSRIAYLERLIAEIPQPERGMTDEEDRQIEAAIKEIERWHNIRNEARRTFRRNAKVRTMDGRLGATIDTTMSVITDPEILNINKQALLVSFLIKGHRIRTAVKMAGDIELETLDQIKIIIPEPTDKIPQTSFPEKQPKAINISGAIQQIVSEIAAKEEVNPEPEGEPINESADVEKQASTEKGETPKTTSIPEKFAEADLDGQQQETRKERGRANKRKTSYREPLTSPSESQSKDNHSEEKVKNSKSAKKNKAATKTSEKKKARKQRAKDGRELIDLSDRIRLPNGRLGGYKPGCVSKAKRPQSTSALPKISTSNESSMSTQQKGATPRTYPKKALTNYRQNQNQRGRRFTR